jgi:hypothetical protein
MPYASHGQRAIARGPNSLASHASRVEGRSARPRQIQADCSLLRLRILPTAPTQLRNSAAEPGSHLRPTCKLNCSTSASPSTSSEPNSSTTATTTAPRPTRTRSSRVRLTQATDSTASSRASTAGSCDVDPMVTCPSALTEPQKASPPDSVWCPWPERTLGGQPASPITVTSPRAASCP